MQSKCYVMYNVRNGLISKFIWNVLAFFFFACVVFVPPTYLFMRRIFLATDDRMHKNKMHKNDERSCHHFLLVHSLSFIIITSFRLNRNQYESFFFSFAFCSTILPAPNRICRLFICLHLCFIRTACVFYESFTI